MRHSLRPVDSVFARRILRDAPLSPLRAMTTGSVSDGKGFDS